MTVIKFEVFVSTDDILAAIGAAGLDKLERDSATLFALWAEEGERVAVEAFRQEASPDGKAWAPLSPATLSRRSRTPRVGILRVTRNLIDSLVGEVTGDGAEIGSTLQAKGGRYNLLAIHQYGATVRRSGRRGPYEIVIPARPVLPVDAGGNILPQFADEIEAITADWLAL